MSKTDITDVTTTPVAPVAAKEVGVFQKVKAAATSPTAKTIGTILGATLAGAAGGLLAVEARQRGYFGGAKPL